MAAHHTEEQVKQNYVAAMGPTLGKFFHQLWNECVWLHWKWDEYVALFGTKQQRLDLLMKTAPAFFTVVDDCLWNDVLLHLARLTDPKNVAGKDTLTLHRLPQLVEPAVRDAVWAQLKDVINKTKFARDRRNRHIGHRELSLALQENAKPLEPASRKAVSDAIKAVADLLNVVDEHYCNSTVGYEHSKIGDAEALLQALRAAQHAFKDRDRAFEAAEMELLEWEREPE